MIDIIYILSLMLSFIFGARVIGSMFRDDVDASGIQVVLVGLAMTYIVLYNQGMVETLFRATQ